MNKKEKILSALLVLSMASLISSAIFTIYQLKPAGYEFRIEKMVKKVVLSKITNIKKS